ncbi:hypothetical protein BLNAU_12288 [Blattamonas nauphoetae]|uniref:Uncharacterized protein n=1 Tax=Blattamonas nauphoetae TaxID=2049346 RepID=A0ABQ9XMU7_9EUKA|nr:hypothetical protein BLNAU_12288 [Blattamonas nauphoetae]
MPLEQGAPPSQDEIARWSTYLSSCGFSIVSSRYQRFDSEFKGRSVQWKGTIKSIDSNILTIVIDHKDDLSFYPDIALFARRPTIQSNQDRIKVGEQLEFRAKFHSIPSEMTGSINMILSARNSSQSETLSISYEDFVKTIFTDLPDEPQQAFCDSWKGKPLSISGSVAKVDKPPAGVAPAAKLIINPSDGYASTDKVAVVIPNRHYSLFSQIEQLEPNTTFTFDGILAERRNEHRIVVESVKILKPGNKPLESSQSITANFSQIRNRFRESEAARPLAPAFRGPLKKQPSSSALVASPSAPKPLEINVDYKDKGSVSSIRNHFEKT